MNSTGSRIDPFNSTYSYSSQTNTEEMVTSKLKSYIDANVTERPAALKQLKDMKIIDENLVSYIFWEDQKYPDKHLLINLLKNGVKLSFKKNIADQFPAQNNKIKQFNAVKGDIAAFDRINKFAAFVDGFERNKDMTFEQFDELRTSLHLNGDIHRGENKEIVSNDDDGRNARSYLVDDIKQALTLLSKELDSDDKQTVRNVLMAAALKDTNGCFAAQSRNLAAATSKVQKLVSDTPPTPVILDFSALDALDTKISQHMSNFIDKVNQDKHEEAIDLIRSLTKKDTLDDIDLSGIFSGAAILDTAISCATTPYQKSVNNEMCGAALGLNKVNMKEWISALRKLDDLSAKYQPIFSAFYDSQMTKSILDCAYEKVELKTSNHSDNLEKIDAKLIFAKSEIKFSEDLKSHCEKMTTNSSEYSGEIPGKQLKFDKKSGDFFVTVYYKGKPNKIALESKSENLKKSQNSLINKIMEIINPQVSQKTDDSEGNFGLNLFDF
jgi:hypothetical protein